MGKLDIDNSLPELDDFEDEAEAEAVSNNVARMTKDMRRRLEDRLDDARLSRELCENNFNFKDI